MEEIWLLARMRDRRRVAEEIGENPKVQSQPLVVQPRSLSPSRPELTKREVGDRRQSVVAHVQAIVPTLERSKVLNGSDPKTCNRSIQSQSKRTPRRVTSHRIGAERWGTSASRPETRSRSIAARGRGRGGLKGKRRLTSKLQLSLLQRVDVRRCARHDLFGSMRRCARWGRGEGEVDKEVARAGRSDGGTRRSKRR